MGLLFNIFKALSEDDSYEKKRQMAKDRIFEDECLTWGLSEEEKQECRKLGITPEEWAEENDPDYEKD